MKHFALIALPFALSAAAFATPITGQFSLTGMSVTDNGSTLTFISNVVHVGDTSTLYGSFQTLLTSGEAGIISSPIDYTHYTPGSASLTFTNPGSSLTFLLNSIAIVNNGDFRNFIGTGTVTSTAPGYEQQSANLFFTTQASGTTTFSATAVAPAQTPEPSTLALLGSGLLAGTAALRRRLL